LAGLIAGLLRKGRELRGGFAPFIAGDWIECRGKHAGGLKPIGSVRLGGPAAAPQKPPP
jgi:hypothetical protein